MSRYFFSEYSPDWPRQFQEERRFLMAHLTGLVEVHHIGSTSAPGLAAKPIIDLLPLVGDIRSMDAQSDVLVQAGYKPWGEFGLPGRRYFTKDRDGVRTHNLHFYAADHPDAARHLAFAAYLQTHPEERGEYEQLKRAVYAQHPDDIGAYNDGKNDWIKRVEILAMDWWRTR